jgi:integrase
MPLTATTIRTAKSTDKTKRMYDTGGLYLEVAPAGGKWWRLKYRFAGKEKRLALGVYPDISLQAARKRRDEARSLLANDLDPSENKRAQRATRRQSAGNSFEVIAREWFEKFSTTWASGHSERILSRLKRDVFPWIGNEPITELTAPKLLSVVQRIEERGALETAHRTLGTCGKVFRYAVATGRAERDPSGDLRGALPPIRGKHFAAVTDPDEVGPLLRKLDGYEGTLVVRCALRLAPLVFVRPGELRRARWADVDIQSADWRFTVTKTETEHIVPLSKQAVEILGEVEPLTGRGEYVFPSARGRNRPMSSVALLAAMRSMEIPKETMSGHGFRAMARTILDEVLHVRPDFIEHQLAHAVRDPNGRAYNRTAHLAERREMMQQWADYLDELKAGGTVIPTNRRAGS